MAFHGMIGRKLGMTQIFAEDGTAVPVTVLEMAPNAITQVRTQDTDGYTAIQVAYGERKEKNLTKPEIGHFKKAGVAPAAFVREFRVPAEELEGYEAGAQVTVETFEGVEHVDVAGTSKGSGFTGVMKRHNFAGCNTQTHGTHEYFRHGGSIGMGTFPGRVFKGKKMAGHLGDSKVTIQNLQVVKTDLDRGLIMIKGAVPGAKNSYITIEK